VDNVNATKGSRKRSGVLVIGAPDVYFNNVKDDDLPRTQVRDVMLCRLSGKGQHWIGKSSSRPV